MSGAKRESRVTFAYPSPFLAYSQEIPFGIIQCTVGQRQELHIMYCRVPHSALLGVERLGLKLDGRLKPSFEQKKSIYLIKSVISSSHIRSQLKSLSLTP